MRTFFKNILKLIKPTKLEREYLKIINIKRKADGQEPIARISELENSNNE